MEDRRACDSDRRVTVNNIQVILVCCRPGDRGGGTETPAPVTGAATDGYNLNVVDCNASVTVARPAVLNLRQRGSGGYPQPVFCPAAGGKRER